MKKNPVHKVIQADCLDGCRKLNDKSVDLIYLAPPSCTQKEQRLTTRDPKRVREITLWYEKYPEHFFMWYDNADETPLIEHFNKHFKAVLLGKK